MSPLPLLVATLLSPQAGVPTGPQLIDRSAAAYRSVKTFEQEVSSVITGSTATAHIWFSRPGKMRIAGRTLFGTNYDMVADGKQIWTKTANDWQPSQDLQTAVATVTGISAQAGTHVPSALAGLNWGSIAHLKGESTKVTRTKLGGKDAFLMTAAKPFPIKIWFDAKTSYYLRLETTLMKRTTVVSYKPPKENVPIPAGRFKK